MDKPLHEVTIIEAEDIILIYNHIVFYGSMASEELAEKITREAEQMWNEPQGKVLLNGKTYRVIFQLDWELDLLLKDDTIFENQDTWRKFFRIEENHEGNISFVDAIGSNTGFLLVKNIANEGSTTFAHELGHCWNLVHPKTIDFRNASVPHIMCPRGTYVKPEFQYDANKKVWEENGVLQFEQGATLNPIHRKVTQENIDDLQLFKLKFNEESGANLAKLTNDYHYFKG